MSEAQRILALAGEEEPIAADLVRAWMGTNELEIWAAVYELTRTAWERIRPELSADEITTFMLRYLIRCLEESPAPDDYLHGGYEAAWELAAVLQEWRKRGDVERSIRQTVTELTKAYRRGDDTTRNRLVCGVLEHAFEDPALRPYFAAWQRDRDLREAYDLALEWGSAHEKSE